MDRLGFAAVLLLLPLLAQALVPQDVHQLLQSVATAASRPANLRRRLSATGSSEFVVGATVNNTECSVTESSCAANGLVLLTDAAPQPETETGKLVAKLAAKSYVCSLHATAAECTADVANNCQVIEAQYSADNSTSVETCGLNFGEVLKMVMQFGLCPDSLAYNLFKCTGMLEALSSSDLSSSISPTTTACDKGDASCKLLAGAVCMPADLEKKYDLTSTAGATAFQNDMLSMSEKFWGCCQGGAVLATEVNCQSKKTQAECTGKCEWMNTPDFASSTDPLGTSNLMLGGTEAGVCSMSSKSLVDFMVGTNTAFSTYYREANAKCAALTTQMCSKQPVITGISKTKADSYTETTLTPGGGKGCGNSSSRSITSANSSNMRQAGLYASLAGVILALTGFWLL